MTHILLIVALFGGIVGILFFLWTLKKGLLDGGEEVKYQIFREDPPED